MIRSSLVVVLLALLALLAGSASGFWHGKYASDSECLNPNPNHSSIESDDIVNQKENAKDYCKTDRIEEFNSKYVYKLLHDLTNTPYFKYYKVNLMCGCRFWDEDFLCSLRNCAVDTCSEEELPDAYKDASKQKDVVCAVGPLTKLGDINRVIDVTIKSSLEKNDLDLMNNANFCDTGEDEPSAEYVDLTLNPERFTGYSGKAANNIWYNVYKFNSFKDKVDDPNSVKYTEYEVFQRILSGLHASVNLHVVSVHPTDKDGSWDFNLQMFKERFYPRYTDNQGEVWLRNIYYLYSVMMRAIQKACPIWIKLDFESGIKDEDRQTKLIINSLCSSLKMDSPLFDESFMFSKSDDNNAALKEEIRTTYLNITRLMDCVGCEKCRLWGKLQTQGIGTALKILFSDNNLILSRNEIVSIFNAATRYSQSVEFLRKWFSLLDLKDGSRDKIKQSGGSKTIFKTPKDEL